MRVLIAHNETPEKKKWKQFKDAMISILTNVEGFDIKADDIVFGTTRGKIDVNSVKEFDLVIAREEIGGVGIGPGTIRKYFTANPDLRLILIVDQSKKSAGKLNALYDMGYYDALLSNDFKASFLQRLLINGRTKQEAYDYYGLMFYSDYSKLKHDDKKAVDESETDVADIEENKDSSRTSKTAKEQNKDENVKVTKKGAKKKVEIAAEDEPLKDTESKKKKAEKEEKTSKSKSKGEQKGNENVEGKQTSKKGKDKAVAEEKTDASDTTKKKEKGKTSQKAAKEEIVAVDEQSEDVNPPLESARYPVSESTLRDVYYPDEYDDNEYEEYADNDEEVLLEEDSERAFDASDYLVSVMGDNVHIDAPDLTKKDADIGDIKKYIEAIGRKALHPIKINVNLTRVDIILEEILVYYTEQDVHWLADLESGILSKDRFSQHLWQRITMLYGELSQEEQEYVFQRFSSFMWGYDVITPLIEDPTISDIALVDYNNIQVKRYGERYLSTITFRTPSHFKNFINHIIRFNHVDLSDKKPNKTFMDTSTSALARMRFVYSQEYINANGEPSLVIRKVPTKKYTIDELVSYGMMDYRTGAIILEEVRAGHSIIWTGTMASGKSSQMNLFLDYIRHDQRGLVIQENEELFSNTHPLLQFQNIRPSEDGETLYDLRYLATFGLLMDLNYFIISEIKGAESEQFVEAVYTNTICWASVHSISARDALPRIASLAVTKHFSEEEQLRKLSGGIDLVVYLNKFVVEEIVRVKGWDEENKCTIYESVDINIPEKPNRELKKGKDKG